MRSIADTAEERWIGTQMIDREKVLNGLECLAQVRDPVANPCRKCGYADRPNYAMCVVDCSKDALELLKGQEESIPVSWLKEKLEGHPELPYAVTDGINNVLDLWEGR